MHPFDVLADPARRRMLEVLAEGEQPAGALVYLVRAEFGISQPAVSQHLRVLRENGFATVRAEGPRRIYALDPAGPAAAEAALARLRAPWTQRLDALGTEIARGKRRPAAAGTTTMQAAPPRPARHDRKDAS
ncbi:ArsR/SmtB family transcription factor [Microbacterium jiangjiandongii]|uniref:ArsR/SmtB family transcription factor n=1 Tax=Microbacterium jiangjiandongii TaxID=3049071 RepID=UPI00214C725E|nr:metalloregulator ArsR/SmtB family transcription factor [Microbacterium sp. zg.Y843]MCR2815823.1 metalloregulator ArsR/SmtB family transcription factor [Microbacterium sp. zg.Y843]